MSSQCIQNLSNICDLFPPFLRTDLDIAIVTVTLVRVAELADALA
jgi:hypothetical protein